MFFLFMVTFFDFLACTYIFLIEWLFCQKIKKYTLVDIDLSDEIQQRMDISLFCLELTEFFIVGRICIVLVTASCLMQYMKEYFFGARNLHAALLLLRV